MKISREFSLAAVTLGIMALALGTSTPNLAAGRARALPTVAVVASFDTCLIDSSGDQLIWNSTTGAYAFTRASDGFMLSGTGVVGVVNGIKTLTDSKTDRRISAGLNSGQLTGSAIVYLQVAQGVWQVLRIIDTNPSAQCTFPPVITSFFASSDCFEGHANITWASTGGTSAVLELFHLSGSLVSSTPVATSGSTFNGNITCGDTLTLVVTGPGGTTSQTIKLP